MLMLKSRRISLVFGYHQSLHATPSLPNPMLDHPRNNDGGYPTALQSPRYFCDIDRRHQDLTLQANNGVHKDWKLSKTDTERNDILRGLSASTLSSDSDATHIGSDDTDTTSAGLSMPSPSHVSNNASAGNTPSFSHPHLRPAPVPDATYPHTHLCSNLPSLSTTCATHFNKIPSATPVWILMLGLVSALALE
ncbi:hypothetical protein BOTBODRAFT_172787 [Botryobasidium botryosum FD-172 SS1]|uniref:Uncharacterized protein n=1 Tax=Botryobasidium botryosum (strain FD-172 SS1) TaxID=930990 RepID=A0A067MM83_BOTB1|nr:hypothetical protein BOTBODRAFT_172787 [Botryobasidium botryosum FD-172 SS1]